MTFSRASPCPARAYAPCVSETVPLRSFSLLPSPARCRHLVPYVRPSSSPFFFSRFAYRILRDTARRNALVRRISRRSILVCFPPLPFSDTCAPPVPPPSFPSSFPVFSCAASRTILPFVFFLLSVYAAIRFGCLRFPEESGTTARLCLLLSRLSRLPHSLSYNTRCNVGFY